MTQVDVHEQFHELQLEQWVPRTLRYNRVDTGVGKGLCRHRLSSNRHPAFLGSCGARPVARDALDVQVRARGRMTSGD